MLESAITIKGANVDNWLGNFRFNNEWIGLYPTYNGTRKGWIGHNGGNTLTIKNEASGNAISLTGNPAVTGTLSVAGATTLTGALNANGNVYLPNHTFIYGKSTSGTSLYVAGVNNNNIILLGYGSYEKAVGSTGLYGNVVNIISKSDVNVTGNIGCSGGGYFDTNIRIGNNGTLTTEYALATYWKDGSVHNLASRASDGLTSYFGWAGSASYASICNLRSRTCRYTNSAGTTTLSDKNLKKDFTEFTDKHDKFFDNLKPKSYKYILGSSNRSHFGYITQEVEEALDNVGLSTKDFAGVNIMPISIRETEINEDTGEAVDIYNSADNYLLDNGINEQHNLVYTEFIALNTWQIQKLKNQVKEQQKEIDELKSLVNKLISKVGGLDNAS
jgi:hypothetical protein